MQLHCQQEEEEHHGHDDGEELLKQKPFAALVWDGLTYIDLEDGDEDEEEGEYDEGEEANSMSIDAAKFAAKVFRPSGLNCIAGV